MVSHKKAIIKMAFLFTNTEFTKNFPKQIIWCELAGDTT
jgi:hypothetical protein